MAWRNQPQGPVRDGIASLPLAEFVHEASPELDPPWHIKPFVDVLERSLVEPVRCVVACPPQHGKTTLVNHHIARSLRRNPKLRWVYISNAALPAQLQSRHIRRIYQFCGGEMSPDMNTIAQWQTPVGGGLLPTSIDGQFTGQPSDHIILDDPYKNREIAESLEYREQVSEFVRSVCLPRLWPGGSFIVVATRWHEDDESGRLVEKGWPYLNMPAIDEEGRALWPDKKPIEFLDQFRDPSSKDYIGEPDWESLFMGNPRPKGGALFGIPSFYDLLPEGPPRRFAIGIDLAYSDGARSDWAVAVVMAEILGTYYVLSVFRIQGSIVEVESMIREARLYAGLEAPIVTYASGPEKGNISYMNVRGIPIMVLPARYNKYIRAQKSAEAWREGRLLVPRESKWLGRYVQEVKNFSGGPGDVHDDQVDATVAAYDLLAATRAGTSPKKFLMGRRVM